ncbi:uncharacterized protein AFUA_4G13625 [Aspergillus fumigatus Af293]|jgi:hypothetical protein
MIDFYLVAEFLLIMTLVIGEILPISGVVTSSGSMILEIPDDQEVKIGNWYEPVNLVEPESRHLHQLETRQGTPESSPPSDRKGFRWLFSTEACTFQLRVQDQQSIQACNFLCTLSLSVTNTVPRLGDLHGPTDSLRQSGKAKSPWIG